MNTNNNKPPEINHAEIRRQIWQLLADNDDISLNPSEKRFHWEVSVDGLGLYFDPIPHYEWSTLLMRIKACKGALDAAGDDMRAMNEAIERQLDEEYRAKLKRENQEQ